MLASVGSITRSLSAPFFVAFSAYYVAVYALSFAMPFYLMSGIGVSGAAAGGILALRPLGAAITAAVVARWLHPSRMRLLAVVGLSVVGAAIAFGAAVPASGLAGALLLIAVGIGSGLFIPANHLAAVSAVRPIDQGLLNGTLASLRNVATAVGLSSASLFLGRAIGPALAAPAVLSASRSLFAILVVPALIAAILCRLQLPALDNYARPSTTRYRHLTISSWANED